LCRACGAAIDGVVDCALEISLARADEASLIAACSRDLVEHGLAWRWTPARIHRAIHAKDMNVAVARSRGQLVGFGILQYLDEEAHLCLLAVVPARRREGIGAALMAWLERTALDAGIGVVRLEARARNASARAFYRRLGYREVMVADGMYARDEDGVRIAKDLWAHEGS
jgi:ribosomal-protein-alanine N-acetyltransferase